MSWSSIDRRPGRSGSAAWAATSRCGPRGRHRPARPSASARATSRRTLPGSWTARDVGHEPEPEIWPGQDQSCGPFRRAGPTLLPGRRPDGRRPGHGNGVPSPQTHLPRQRDARRPREAPRRGQKDSSATGSGSAFSPRRSPRKKSTKYWSRPAGSNAGAEFCRPVRWSTSSWHCACSAAPTAPARNTFDVKKRDQPRPPGNVSYLLKVTRHPTPPAETPLSHPHWPDLASDPSA